MASWTQKIPHLYCKNMCSPEALLKRMVASLTFMLCQMSTAEIRRLYHNNMATVPLVSIRFCEYAKDRFGSTWKVLLGNIEKPTRNLRQGRISVYLVIRKVILLVLIIIRQYYYNFKLEIFVLFFHFSSHLSYRQYRSIFRGRRDNLLFRTIDSAIRIVDE